MTLSVASVLALAVGVFFLGTPLVLTCVGFMVLMAAQAFVFGNSAAIAASQATHVAGAASAMLGVAMAVAGALSAPLATAGGGATAVPMVVVMVIGIGGSVICLVLGRRGELRGSAVRP